MTPLEKEIFGDVLSRRPPVTARLDRGAVLAGNAITRDKLVKVLSSIELAQYDLSAKSNPKKLKELSALAVSRYNERTAISASDALKAHSKPAPSVESYGSPSAIQDSVSAPPVAEASPAAAEPVKRTRVRRRSSSTEKSDNQTALESVSPGSKKGTRKKSASVALKGAVTADDSPGLPSPATELNPPSSLNPNLPSTMSNNSDGSEEKKDSPESGVSAVHGNLSEGSKGSPPAQANSELVDGSLETSSESPSVESTEEEA